MKNKNFIFILFITFFSTLLTFVFFSGFIGFSVFDTFSRITIDSGIIVLRASFNGDTTSFIELNDSALADIENLVLEKTGYGKIFFIENVNLTQDARDNVVDLDNNVVISTNLIQINTNNLTSLDKFAILYLYGLGFDNPEVLVNGAECPDSVCTIIGYSGGTLIFSVSNFSLGAYSTREISLPYVPPSSGSSSSGGGGGSGGSGSSISGISEIIGVISPSEEIQVLTDKLDVYMAVDVSKIVTVRINNLYTGNKKVNFSSIGFDLTGENMFELKPGINDIELKIRAIGQAGFYTGKLFVEGHQIPVNLNVQTKELLFDVLIDVENNPKRIGQGMLDAKVTITPKADESRLDCTLVYTIKDFNGKVWLKESETILVDGLKTIDKTFSGFKMLPGKYTLGVELIYPNGVAVSSASFDVLEQETPVLRYKPFNMIFWIIGIVVFIFIIVLIIRKKIKRNTNKKNK
ncbi:MAG: hypothetical protein ACP5OG_03155 [Candidatus Nanoarchaeia archaeon]